MRLRGWVSFSKLAAGSLSSASWRRKQPQAAAAATLCRQKHVCLLSQSGANMAEEAKKLAAYAAVDNHVQVPSAHLRYHLHTGSIQDAAICLFVCFFS